MLCSPLASSAAAEVVEDEDEVEEVEVVAAVAATAALAEPGEGAVRTGPAASVRSSPMLVKRLASWGL